MPRNTDTSKALEARKRILSNRVTEHESNPTRCEYCGLALPYEKRNNKFCDHSCAATSNNKVVGRHGKGHALCSKCRCAIKWNGIDPCQRCRHKIRQDQYIERWLAGNETGIVGDSYVSKRIRRYAFESFGGCCEICLWCEINPHTGSTPLHLDHVDGNYKNNSPDNLRLLCPNCHALTSTYGSLNRGNGRPFFVQKR